MAITFRTVLQGIILLANIVGQAMQNIFLPLALSDGDDMSVVFIYTAFVYFCFFCLLDVVLDLFCKKHLDFYIPRAEALLVNVSFQNALNGVGVVFGGSSERMPLTLQMSCSLLVNLVSPFYKLFVYNIHPREFSDGKMVKAYLLASALYILTFILTLVDKISNTDSGSINGFGMFFIVGVFFGMTYNVHQDKLIHKLDYSSMTLIESAKVCTSLLRKQLTWLFIFSWLSVLLSFIPGVNQSGTFNTDRFLKSWADFITFQNTNMNLFNLGYIICFITGVFLNKFDSSFNMLTSNVSAVLSLWTGWMPSIRMQTVGFYPTIAYTVPAIVLSCVAIVPSYFYSRGMQAIVRTHLAAGDKDCERQSLINGQKRHADDIPYGAALTN